MGTARFAQCPSPSPLPQASKAAELGYQMREMLRNSTDNDRGVALPTKTGAKTLHAESLQAELVPKLSDEEWLAQ